MRKITKISLAATFGGPTTEFNIPVNVTKVTTLVNGQEVVVPQFPIWATTIDRNNRLLASDQLARQFLMDLKQAYAFSSFGYMAPLAVSNSIPEGYIAIRNQRIIYNENLGEQEAKDADGDHMVVHPEGVTSWEDLGKLEPGTMMIPQKFPNTHQVKPMALINWHPSMEKFMDLTAEESFRLLDTFNPFKTKGKKQEYALNIQEDLTGLTWSAYDPIAAFMKMHSPVPVGLLTDAWNTYDIIKQAFSRKSYNEKIMGMYSSEMHPKLGSRYNDIEKGGLKVSRKDDLASGQFVILNQRMKLQNPARIMLLLKSGIPSLPSAQLDWVKESSFPDFMEEAHRLLSLKLKPEDTWESDVEVDLTLRNPVGPCVLKGAKLLEHLEELGAIKFITKGKCQVVVLFDPVSGEEVGFTDIKRNNRIEGLSWVFVLPPIFDAMPIYQELSPEEMANPDNWVLVEDAPMEWSSARDYIARRLNTMVDNQIKNPTTGELAGTDRNGKSPFWPRNIKEFQDPKWEVRHNIVLDALLKIVGEIGINLPTYRDENGKLSYCKEAMATIQQMATIDYGYEAMPIPQMLEIFQEANVKAKAYGLQLSPGSKSSDSRIRRYAWANKVGGAIWSKETSHPDRTAKISGQMARVMQSCDMVVAFVNAGTLTQVWATPSGIKKQYIPNAFMPKILHTREEYEAHVEKIREKLIQAQQALASFTLQRHDKIKGSRKKKLQNGLENSAMTQAFAKAGLFDAVMEAEYGSNLPSDPGNSSHAQSLARRIARLEEILAEAIANEKGVTWRTWKGTLRKGWIGTGKATIELGKLVDPEGNKFMLADLEDQVTYVSDPETGELGNIDLVFPVTELIAKGNVCSFLGDCEEKTVTIHGNEVKAMVGTFRFFRTSSGSENDPPSWRQVDYISDKQAVEAAFARLGHDVTPQPLSEEAQEPLRELFRLMKFCKSTHDSYLDSFEEANSSS